MQLVVCLLVNVFPEHVCLLKAAYAPSQARLSFRSRAPEDHQDQMSTFWLCQFLHNWIATEIPPLLRQPIQT